MIKRLVYPTQTYISPYPGGRVDGADVVSVQKGVAEHADGDTEEQPGRHARLSLRHRVSPGPHTPTSTCHVKRDNNVT